MTTVFTSYEKKLHLDKNTDTEMHEWVLSHCAAFNEVRVNLNAVLKGT